MEEIAIMKGRETLASIDPLQFDCQAPLKFYEHCRKCPRFSDECHYLKMGLDLFLREKDLCYSAEV